MGSTDVEEKFVVMEPYPEKLSLYVYIYTYYIYIYIYEWSEQIINRIKQERIM